MERSKPDQTSTPTGSWTQCSHVTGNREAPGDVEGTRSSALSVPSPPLPCSWRRAGPSRSTTTLQKLPVGAGGGRTVTVTEANNGQTITKHRGDVLVVTLASTYWQFNRSTGVLMADGTTAVAAGGAHCPRYPGSGCGTVTQRYRATNAGPGTASAPRTSCGEAFRCSAEQSRWRITVDVSTPGVHAASVGVVSGSVTGGPTCPVERPGQSCPALPVPGTIHAIGTSRPPIHHRAHHAGRQVLPCAFAPAATSSRFTPARRSRGVRSPRSPLPPATSNDWTSAATPASADRRFRPGRDRGPVSEAGNG